MSLLGLPSNLVEGWVHVTKARVSRTGDRSGRNNLYFLMCLLYSGIYAKHTCHLTWPSQPPYVVDLASLFYKWDNWGRIRGFRNLPKITWLISSGSISTTVGYAATTSLEKVLRCDKGWDWTRINLKEANSDMWQAPEVWQEKNGRVQAVPPELLDWQADSQPIMPS